MTRPGRFVLLLPLLLAAQPVNGAPAAAPSAASGAGAPTVAPSAAVAAFDQFIARSGPLCAKQASGRCVDAGLAFADRDADGRLSVDELESLHREMKAWLAWKGPKLTASERTAASLGVWMIDTAGLPALFDSFDADDDGRLTRSELLADVRLDQRPLGEVLLDPAAVDRSALAGRVGRLAPFLQGFFGLGANTAAR